MAEHYYTEPGILRRGSISCLLVLRAGREMLVPSLLANLMTVTNSSKPRRKEGETMIFEYLTKHDLTDGQLSALGREGWELVTKLHYLSGQRSVDEYVFKRSIPAKTRS